MPPVNRSERTSSSFPVLSNTTQSSSTPQTRTTGFSGNSVFTSGSSRGSSWAENEPHIRDGVAVLRKLNTADSRRALEILTKGGSPTKEDLEALSGPDGKGGVLAKLASSLGEGDLKKLKDAATMLGVLKGFISWMANNMFVGAK